MTNPFSNRFTRAMLVIALIATAWLGWFVVDSRQTEISSHTSPTATPAQDQPEELSSLPTSTDEMQLIVEASAPASANAHSSGIADEESSIAVTDQERKEPSESRASLTGQAAREQLIATGQHSSLMRAFAEARHQVDPLTEREAEMEQNEGVRYFASNPGQQITARFLDDGVRFESSEPGRDWQAVFGAGSGDPSTSVMEVSGARVAYQRGNVTEWYVNRPEGVEHGFTLNQRPSDTPAGAPVEMEVPLSGIHAEVDPEFPDDLRLVTAEGDAVLAYRGLKVWDAEGTLLAASMNPTSSGLAISVDDNHAIYPIEIDPVIISIETRLTPEGGAFQKRFGDAVALSGDTALFGVFRDNSAYVFVRNGATWSQQAKLTASDAEALDQFGWSVALSGDTALIGTIRDNSESGSAYVFVRSGVTWSEQQKLTASDGAVSDHFAISVALDGDTALIGSNGDDAFLGSAYVFVRNGVTWSQQQKLTASDGKAGDVFGASVALSGDTALIGAYNSDAAIIIDQSSFDIGSAYVFERSGTTWTEEQKLTASDGTGGDLFGYSVALDGDTALISALGIGRFAGGAYVFVRSGNNWTEEQKLTDDDGMAFDQFGDEVALSGDTALIGAFAHATVNGLNSGSAFVFARSGTTWNLQQELIADEGAFDDQFGFSVALSGDTALIGAGQNDTVIGANAGTGYVFVRQGNIWTTQTRLTPEDGAFGDQFGLSLALSGDTSLIGAPVEDTASGVNAGAAYVFTRIGTTWSQQKKLTDNSGEAGDQFGTSVALDGDTALIGAPLDDLTSVNIGSVIAFVRYFGTTWGQERKFYAGGFPTGGERFGSSVALDGNTALIGEPFDDRPGATDAGSAYVFVGSSGNAIWTQTAMLNASDLGANDSFGYRVALDGDIALIGAYFEDPDGVTDAGSAYVFVRSLDGTTWNQEQKLFAADKAASDLFGISLAVSGDTALVGAYLADTSRGGNAGSAYVFVRNADSKTWSQQQKLVASSDGAANDLFGISVALSGDIAVIGANHDDDPVNGVDSGSAYVFARTGVQTSAVWKEQAKLTAGDGAANDRFGFPVAMSGNTVLIGAFTDDTFNGFDAGSAYLFVIDSPYKIFHTHSAFASLDQPGITGVPRLKLPPGIGVNIQGSLTNFMKVLGDSDADGPYQYVAAKGLTRNVILPIFADTSPENGIHDSGELILDYQTVTIAAFNAPDETVTVPLGASLLPAPAAFNHSGAFAREVLKDNGPAFDSVTNSLVVVSEDGAGRFIGITPEEIGDLFRVAWRVEGPFGIEWPYANYAYQVEIDAGPNPIQFATTAGVNNPGVILPGNTEMVYAVELNSEEPLTEGEDYFLNGGELTTIVPGLFVVKHDPTPGEPRSGDEVYVSLIALDHQDSQLFDPVVSNRVIGSELLPPPGATYGRIHTGTRFAQALPGGGNVYADTGKIIPVNTESDVEVWWHQEFVVPDSGGAIIKFPGIVRRYNFVWPNIPVTGPVPDGPAVGKIVIASQIGTGEIDPVVYKDFGIYSQNEPLLPGFNPNDEHAKEFPAQGGGSAIFALRSDLGRPETSLPYVLMHYRDPSDTDGDKQYRFKVFRVVAEDAVLGQTFNYAGDPDPFEAGKALNPPYPLSLLSPSAPDNKGDGVSGPFFEDANGDLWAMAAGDDGGAETIVLDWYYRNQPEFFYPSDVTAYTGVESVPFLDNNTLDPQDVSYEIEWPTDAPELQMGETRVGAKNGLDEIEGNNSVDAIYEQGVALGLGDNVTVIDFRKERKVTLSDFGELATIPGDVEFEQVGNRTVFGNLPPALAQRLYYDSGSNELRLGGELFVPGLGEPFVLLNVITADEKAVLLDSSFYGSDNNFRAALEALSNKAASAIEVLPGDTSFVGLALTTGSAQAQGFVTLAFNNITNETVVLKVIRVIPELYRGAVQAISPKSLFDEKLTLIFDGDLGGRSSEYEFEWRSAPFITDLPSPTGSNDTDWSLYAIGEGMNNITIDGSGAQFLAKMFFTCRYRPLNPNHPLFAGGAGWSDWTPVQLAEGWIDRVLAELNVFEQKFSDLSNPQNIVDTRVSMVSLAGPRWEGAIPFTQEGATNSSIIEAYETILQRGIDFSIEGNPPVDNEPVNQALRLAATRLANLYMLLGHEAYSDATDPTIAVSAEYLSSVTSIHSFQNGPGGSSLLEEELSLLRGRDDFASLGVTLPPIYNRLPWNFTRDDGEVAYVNNYGIRDNDSSGSLDELDAKIDYPQGHGDAWGHYLTAIKSFYRLLHHSNFSWPTDPIEEITIGSQIVPVDYRHAAKFAKAAAARAQAGSEIVSLTHRDYYSEDPAKQWRGYRDPKSAPEDAYPDGSFRAWGLDDWGARAGQGAYLDWVVGNALLPDVDTLREGSQKIDRSSITELQDLSASLTKIQNEVDKADRGLNPLGLIKNTLPLSLLSVDDVDAKTTLFDKTYEKTVTMLNNALAVFIRAQGASQQLRAQSDQLVDFQRTIDQREMDFRNRMIEIYGRPYSDDMGGNGQYRFGYPGADIYHYMYTEPSELTGIDEANQDTVTFSMPLADLGIHDDRDHDSIDPDGVVNRTDKVVTFHLSTQGFGYIKPDSFTGSREATGLLQITHSEILQARARLNRAINDYDNLLGEIEDRVELLQAQYDLNASEIRIEKQGQGVQERLNDAIARNREREISFRHIGRFASTLANAAAEGLPNNAIVIAGLANGGGGDFTAPARAAIRTGGALIDQAMAGAADNEALAELGHQQAKETVQFQTSIQLTSLRNDFGIVQEIKQIEAMIRQEAGLRLEIFTSKEGLIQVAERYKSLLAQGFRLQEELLLFRQQTAASVQEQRYKDMAFRIFRNDALEKYRAQFDLAATWVYMAVRAYDYDTNWGADGSEPQGVVTGRSLLEDIVKARAVGEISGGQPITSQNSGDGGLADAMARMKSNWESNRDLLGYNQPQNFTTRFSLRKEFFRIPRGTHPVDNDKIWRETLQRHVVENILLVPEIVRYCILPANSLPQPAIVIPFATSIENGQNFFGWPLEGGENNFPSTLGANRIKKYGVWFSNYDNSDNGLANTPNIYLVPVGVDIMRSPRGGGIREWRIQEQVIPKPDEIYTTDGEGNVIANSLSPAFIPMLSGGSQSGSEVEIRRFPETRAYHDSGSFNESELVANNERLIGRSVWNTRWLLIIPGRNLNNDAEEGIRRFIEGQRNGQGVKDILINFQSYAIPGF